MTYPTREQLEEYIRNNKLDVDESYPRSDWWKFRNERDSLRKQRDELIKDINQLRERNVELERKAQAFDEIVNAVDESANSYELVARIKLEVLKYQKLESEE